MCITNQIIYAKSRVVYTQNKKGPHDWDVSRVLPTYRYIFAMNFVLFCVKQKCYLKNIWKQHTAEYVIIIWKSVRYASSIGHFKNNRTKANNLYVLYVTFYIEYVTTNNRKCMWSKDILLLSVAGKNNFPNKEV